MLVVLSKKELYLTTERILHDHFLHNYCVLLRLLLAGGKKLQQRNGQVIGKWEN
jgi:hypothetical protein